METADDRVACAYNETDPRLIELGIIQTQSNANFKRINSFAYYQTEIDEYIAQGLSSELLDGLVGHYRKQWERFAETKRKPTT
jgi:hypothetical protein